MNASEASDFRPEALEMIVRVGGGKLLNEMIELFRSSSEERIQGIRAAAENGDTAGIGRLCHALKSSAGQLGAQHLQALCADIEHRVLTGSIGDLPSSLIELYEAHAKAGSWLQSMRRG